MTKALLVVATLALGTASAAPPRPTPLPLNAAELIKRLEASVKAGTAAETERITRVLVVLGPRAKAVLQREVKRPRSPILPQVLDAISRMAPDMRLLARPLLASSDPKVRAMAAEALAGADPTLLKTALQREQDAAVQFSIVASLGEGQGAAATSALCEALATGNEAMRVKALEGLRTRRDRRALSDIHAALRDPHGAVRLEAIRTAGALHDNRSLRPLLDLATAESDAPNLDALFEALKSITGQDFGRDLDAWNAWLDSGS